MISFDIETRALEYLAADEFCAPSEIETVIALWDGDVTETAPLVAEWTERGGSRSCLRTTRSCRRFSISPVQGMRRSSVAVLPANVR